jgi:hypothetical protein
MTTDKEKSLKIFFSSVTSECYNLEMGYILIKVADENKI